MLSDRGSGAGDDDTMTTTNDGVTITASMTRPTRPGKAPRPVWEVSCPPALVPLMYDLGARKWGRTFSFWEDPTERIARALETYTPPTFGERKEAEKERAEARAKRREEWADGHREKAAALDRQNEPFRGDVAFNTQPGHIPERARAIRRTERAGEHAEAASMHEARAESTRRNAGRDNDPGFCQRRIEEAEAEARGIRRDLAGSPAHTVDGTPYLKKPEPGSEWAGRLLARLKELEERIAYYRQRVADAGGARYSPETIQPGDIIRHGRELGRVLRVNPKTVTYEIVGGPCAGWKFKAPYAEILGKNAPAEFREEARPAPEATTE